MKMPILLKCLLSWALLMLVLCMVGMFAAGDKELQAILQPAAIGGFLLLVPLGLVAIWKD